MPHFKNSNNELFWLDEGDDAQVWLPGCVQITDAEAANIRAANQQAAFDALTYSQKRASEYPPITDYIDGVVKGDQAQIDAYIAACLAVKAKYPKEQA
jgi:hypothetical protein